MLIICAILVLLSVTIVAVLLFIHCVCLVQLCDELLAPAARHSICGAMTMDSQMKFKQVVSRHVTESALPQYIPILSRMRPHQKSSTLITYECGSCFHDWRTVQRNTDLLQ